MNTKTKKMINATFSLPQSTLSKLNKKLLELKSEGMYFNDLNDIVKNALEGYLEEINEDLMLAKIAESRIDGESVEVDIESSVDLDKPLTDEEKNKLAGFIAELKDEYANFSNDDKRGLIEFFEFIKFKGNANFKTNDMEGKT